MSSGKIWIILRNRSRGRSYQRLTSLRVSPTTCRRRRIDSSRLWGTKVQRTEIGGTRASCCRLVTMRGLRTKLVVLALCYNRVLHVLLSSLRISCLATTLGRWQSPIRQRLGTAQAREVEAHFGLRRLSMVRLCSGFSAPYLQPSPPCLETCCDYCSTQYPPR